MLGIVFLSGALSGANAQTSQTEQFTSVRQHLDVYARAARLPPLQATSPDEIRIWDHDYLSGDTVGHVITAGHVTTYQLRTTFGSDDVFRAHFRSRKPTRASALADEVLQHGAELAALNQQVWNCAQSGGVTDIEGVVGGRLFAFSAGNAFACRDARSAFVVQIGSITERMPR